MTKWAITFGLILTGLGLVGYFGHDPNDMSNSVTVSAPADAAGGNGSSTAEKSAPPKTALIPSLFGLALLICGTLGLDQRMRKHAMHAAAAIALIGFLAAGGRAATKLDAIANGQLNRALIFVLLMTLICLIYVVMSVMSFIAARKATAKKQVTG